MGRVKVRFVYPDSAHRMYMMVNVLFVAFRLSSTVTASVAECTTCYIEEVIYGGEVRVVRL